MNCFKLAKNVLDRSFSLIEGSQDYKIKVINEKINALKQGYQSLVNKSEFDYSDEATQFAYIYKYTTAHASFVYDLFRKADRKDTIPKEGTVRMASLGGGPGSDLLGALKFYESSGYDNITINYQSFDKDQGWSYCWSNVLNEAQNCMEDSVVCNLSSTFHPFDVCDQDMIKRIKGFLDYDIFTMVFFMSEVLSLKDKAEPFFSYLFENIKSGTTILFIDNNMYSLLPWFDNYIDKFNYEILVTNEDRWTLPIDEEKNVLGEYIHMFESPKLTGNVAYRVVRKL